ncbi:MAG: PAS domain S-box protein [Bacteroidia bacterium]|nr:PAS domain S-box protein [Bacteroidia bacterium]
MKFLSRLLLVFLLSLTAVLIVSYYYYSNTRSFIREAHGVQEAYQLSNQLEKVLSWVIDAESGQRGYIITMDESYLTPYWKAKQALVREIDTLESLLVAYPHEAQQFAKIKPIIRERMNRLERGLELVKAEQREDAIDYIRAGWSKEAMDQIRRTMGQMIRRMGHNIQELSRQAEHSSLQTLGSVTLAVMLTFLLWLLTFIQAIVDWRNKERLAKGLAQMNDELEGKVLSRTQDLQQSEEQLRLITDALPVLISYVDAEERYRFNNKAYETWFGIPRDQHYGEKIEEVLGEDTYQIIKPYVSAVLAGQEVYYELALPYQHGGFRHVSAQYIPHFYEGKVFGYYALVQDITQQKQAEEEQIKARELAEEREAQLRLSLKAGKMGIWQLDFIQNTARHSPEHDRIFGYPEPLSDWSYEIFMKHVLPEDQALVLESFAQARQSGELDFEARIRRPKGEICWINVKGLTFFDEQRKSLSMAGIVMDVTEQKQAEAELLQAIKALELRSDELAKVNDVLDTFVYTAAHDLKAPVANMKLAVDLAQQSPELIGDNFLRIMNSSVNRLENTIGSLNEVIQVQANCDVPVKEVPLESLLEDIKKDYETQLREIGASLHQDFSKAPQITYVESYLYSILNNLISNAIKYRSEQRKLEIKMTTYPQTDAIQLIFQDNGMGMDLKKNKNALFRAFSRFASHKADGKGIGLYLVKTMVEKNGGAIEVESAPEQGTQLLYFI